MAPKITVVGGSSPFTIELCHQIARTGLRDMPCELMLHGRDEEALARVGAFATAALPHWRVRVATDLPAALDGARMVVHQARYGGLAGRLQDEALAKAARTLPDETIGPGGLQAGLRIASEVRAFGGKVAQLCPEAWVLNLVNPLGVSTALIAQEGARRCVGVCELPVLTQRKIAALLGLEPQALRWEYTGLNHRGFLHDINVGGIDVLGKLVAVLRQHPDGDDLWGIKADVIEAFQAVPLKYFRLFNGGPIHAEGRSRALADIREQAFAELEAAPTRYPASLKRRDMPWYEHAVVPVMGALLGGTPVSCTANLAMPDSTVHERMVDVCADRVDCRPPSPSPPAVGAWLDRFIRHEKAVLDAVRHPSRASIETALKLDPLLSTEQASVATTLIHMREESLHE